MFDPYLAGRYPVTNRPSPDDYLIRDRVAIAGIGQTEFSKSSGRSEVQLACEAIRAAVEDAGLKMEDVDVIELNEAFASQAIYCVQKLGIEKMLEDRKINPNGGAIALGHPLGCTGAKLTVQVLYHMQDNNLKNGIVSMCIGGGMGAAGLFVREE